MLYVSQLRKNELFKTRYKEVKIIWKILDYKNIKKILIKSRI